MAEAWFLPDPIGGGFWPHNPSRSGGPALNGMEQDVLSPAMRWRARWHVRIRNDDEVLAARAGFGRLQGKAGRILVPVFDGRRASWPIDAQGQTLTPRRVKRYQEHLIGTPYEQAEIPASSQINATANALAALRAASITAAITQGGPPKSGQYFGVGGERAHLITSVSGPSGSVWTLGFIPTLRAQVAAAAASIFTRPVCLMKLINDDQVLKELETHRYASLTLEFEEVTI